MRNQESGWVLGEMVSNWRRRLAALTPFLRVEGARTFTPWGLQCVCVCGVYVNSREGVGGCVLTSLIVQESHSQFYDSFTVTTICRPARERERE